MTITFLIDLDDTLLTNNMDTFIPAYLKLLSAAMKEYAPAEKIIPTLMEATQAMVKNDQPHKTLKSCFDANFYPHLDIDADEVHPLLVDFYQSDYRQLEKVTEYRPEAVQLIDSLESRSDRMVIATNPLFPEFAIQPRLDWAGLPKSKVQFEKVTSYENFHFAKPNPAYYAEILAQIGWPEGPVVMIGNDMELDIQPAQKLGLATYFVNKEEECEQHFVLDGEPAFARGWLNKIIPWIEATPEDQLIPAYLSPEAYIAILRSTAAASHTLIRSQSKETLTRRIVPDSWSVGEIFSHLRDVDLEINIPRIQTLLKEEDAFITAVNADLWIEERQYQNQDPQTAFEEFVEARIALLELLSALADSDWSRSARHTIFGPTNLKELVRISARHDRLHMQQIYKTLKDPRI